MPFFREHSLSSLTADKEGGFAALPNDMFGSKAHEVVNSVFKCRDDTSLLKVRTEANTLCNAPSLNRLASSIDKSKKPSSDLFFTVKTNKVDWLLRVVFSEKGTWQKVVALFLQEKLNLRTIDDPFLVKD